MQTQSCYPLIYYCIVVSMPTELLPNFSDKPSVPRSDSAPPAAPGPDLSEPESSVNTATTTVYYQHLMTKQNGIMLDLLN